MRWLRLLFLTQLAGLVPLASAAGTQDATEYLQVVVADRELRQWPAVSPCSIEMALGHASRSEIFSECEDPWHETHLLELELHPDSAVLFIKAPRTADNFGVNELWRVRRGRGSELIASVSVDRYRAGHQRIWRRDLAFESLDLALDLLPDGGRIDPSWAQVLWTPDSSVVFASTRPHESLADEDLRGDFLNFQVCAVDFGLPMRVQTLDRVASCRPELSTPTGILTMAVPGAEKDTWVMWLLVGYFGEYQIHRLTKSSSGWTSSRVDEIIRPGMR